MRIRGVRVVVGPRRLAGLILGVLSLATILLVTWLGGAAWGLTLLAGLLALVMLGVALVYLRLLSVAGLAYQTRQKLSKLGGRVDLHSDRIKRVESLNERVKRVELLSERVKRLEALRERVSKLEALEAKIDSIASDARAGLREVRTAVQSLTESVDARLAATEAVHRQVRDNIIWLRAEQHRRPPAAFGETAREREIDLIRSSGFFDADWYRAQSGVDAADPVAHYVDYAAVSRVDPHPLFNSTWYLQRRPFALAHWLTPLGHFLSTSERTPVDPHPAFWSQWYADRYLGEGTPRTLPVVHFLTAGAAAGYNPNPVFDVRWYVNTHRIPDGVNPLVHYLTEGAAADLDPSPHFSTADARRRLGALAADPLSGFLDAVRDPASRLREPSVIRSVPEEAKAADLRWEYLVRGLHTEPDTFVLYRIIGNDLPPRHRVGQGLENLRFILEHEPELPGCEKRWVLNRIVDPDMERQIIALLEKHGKGYVRIPFDPDEYRKAGWRFDGITPPGLTYRAEMAELRPDQQLRVVDHIYHDKNLYVMNNNGARNAALREGRGRAKWVLPWDGNCFLTREAWAELVRAVTTEPHLKYFVVPMARILDNQELLRPGVVPKADEEPQLVFRRDAAEEFNPDYRYGRRPKVELFWRLGIQGPWSQWKDDPWEVPRRGPSPEAGQFGTASWVARLYSGERELEIDIKGRGQSRIEAVRRQIDRIDESLTAATFRSEALFVLDDEILSRQREQFRAGEPGPKRHIDDLIQRAERKLGGPTYSVTTKTTLPPSGDLHDYWSVAPYWWPNPDTPDGLPYVRRDGQRVPGTVLWAPGSEQYDRSALQSMIDETTQSALAGFFTGDARFFARGAELLRAWFLNPATRMNPHLRFAQVQRGHNNDEGHPSGIIEASDLHYLLDAVRLIEREGALTAAEAAALREWFSEYRAWLEESRQGRVERAALNNHGPWYDVQVATIDAYLGDVRALLDTARRAFERVGQHFAPDGSQPEELKRTQTQHYVAYNLQAWVALATCVGRLGQDLWSYRAPGGSGLVPAALWFLERVGKPWDYPQLDPFDGDRGVAFAHQVAAKVPSSRALEFVDENQRDPWQVKQVFTEHDGIRPFWILGG